MAQARKDAKRETETDAPPAESWDLFVSQSDQFDSGYLPSQDDQSWREREALRIATYENSGHLPLQGDQSWREREALRLTGISDTTAVDPMAELDFGQQAPLPATPATGRGTGGVIAVLAAMVGVIILVLAVPGIVTPAYWRGMAARPAPAPAGAPASVAKAPAHPAPVGAPTVDAKSPTTSELAPRPDMRASVPDQANPRGADGSKAMVIGRDGTVKYENTPANIPSRAKRAARPASRARGKADARETAAGDAGGFYAKVAQPDGTLKDVYFPSGSKSGTAPAVPPRAKTDAHGKDGFYAMVPGPDGALKRTYFPAKPSR
jgi:hypothetical protein